jgi:hypothetical protein
MKGKLMDFWFTTSHGETCHNQLGTPNYFEGEPPQYPLVKINYRLKCLTDGFARIGYPNTGDLKDLGHGRLAVNEYTFANVETISHSRLTQSQLIQFSNIKAGDFILIPADQDQYQVHFGRVLTTDKKVVPPYINPRINAYYYYYDIAKGDWYECAHRVNVQWVIDEDGEFGIFDIPEIGGVWRQAFGQLHKAKERLLFIARKVGFQS